MVHDMKTLRDYIDAERGRAVAIARELGVTPGGVWGWYEKQVPAERVLDIERITGISRYDLRPDVYGQAPSSEAAAS